MFPLRATPSSNEPTTEELRERLLPLAVLWSPPPLHTHTPTLTHPWVTFNPVGLFYSTVCRRTSQQPGRLVCKEVQHQAFCVKWVSRTQRLHYKQEREDLPQRHQYIMHSQHETSFSKYVTSPVRPPQMYPGGQRRSENTQAFITHQPASLSKDQNHA